MLNLVHMENDLLLLLLLLLKKWLLNIFNKVLSQLPQWQGRTVENSDLEERMGERAGNQGGLGADPEVG